jgi:CTP:molybdopterin cytidylyltransferase MocA
VSGVAGLLLAAGAGRRFGRPKALVEAAGCTLVERGVALLRAGGCDPVVVVVGARADDVRPLLRGAEGVVAPDWPDGMGASLRAGLAALERTSSAACVVALVDQPLVTPEAVRRLAAAQGADAAVATYAGRQRNPVLLDRRVWGEVAAAAIGDAGARGWLRGHPGRVLPVPCDDAGRPDDVDTPEDLAAVLPLLPPVATLADLPAGEPA